MFENNVEKENKEESHDVCDQECHKKTYFITKLFGKARRPKFHLEESKGTKEFIGNVKVVLVTTPKRQYREKALGSAFVVLAFFSIGATVLHVLFYCLSLIITDVLVSLHVLLFTIGFQLLMPTAFLTMNTYNGASSSIKTGHRRLDYLVLKLVSLLCVVSGAIATILSAALRIKERVWTIDKLTSHGITGTLAVMLCVVDLTMLLFLPCSSRRVWPRCALLLCFPSFVTSSLCFVTGLYQPSFLKWLPSTNMLYFFIFFCTYYTAFAVVNPFLRLGPSTKDGIETCLEL